MDKVEKFKELFFQITEICFDLGWVKDEEKKKKLNEEYVEKSNKLIKMFEEEVNKNENIDK